ncbi:HAD family acid phosphatase [Marmoricola sp. RAF53]|uniref:HAD family acid phosphatase n=1 Tax=Marmoricola sp. RAF53 TaxID=3233059 RepID=UPI003F98070F
MQHPTSTRRLVAVVVSGAAALTLGFTLGVAAPADAHENHHRHGPALAPRTHFTMEPDGSSGLTAGGAGIPNIDSVKSTIRTYYGAGGDGIANKTTSPYITEMHAIETRALARLRPVSPARKKAIVLDADDTTLWTYDMEDNLMHFNFDPALQATWVFGQKFPATPGMVDFVAAAEAKGYAIFGITGRRFAQEAATVANLEKVGYTAFDADNFFTKWDGPDTNKPAYVTCVAACTTVEYKANTRKHIEQDLGYDIVLNVGDQFSDLQGGYADRALKLPNPTYYLPSANLPGVHEPRLAPRTHFRMAPDGTSGLTAGGEGIPNIDSVKSTIRTYYGADSNGIANKSTSPYISEVSGIARKQTDRLVDRCRHEVREGEQPAVVFDADDTTLWTYDMEDGAMHFNFDPVLQDVGWVQPQKFPAVPGMVDLVNRVGAAGCTVVGLTGRRDPQRAATLGNLAKVGYTAFTDAHYFTKWASGATPPAAVFAGTPCENNPGCTTIQYKSGVRRYVENQGYDVIANFGDQFSDLIGGYADRTVKLPNPTYYLP